MEEQIIQNSIKNNIMHNHIDNLIHNITIPQTISADAGLSESCQDSGPKPIFLCAYPVKSFTGRNAELEQLTSLLNENNIVAVYGTGGVGKTQLVRKYAEVKQFYYNCVFCIPAENLITVDSKLRDLATELNIEVKKHQAKRNINLILNEIYDVLQKQQSLIIFDNTQNGKEIENFLPSVTKLKNTSLHILLTTQYSSWNQRNIKPFELKSLEMLSALDLLGEILNNKAGLKKDKENLAKALGHMPLALQVAASHINTQMKHDKQFTIANYINKLDSDTDDIHMCEPNGYDKNLYKSIKMILTIFEENNSLGMKLINLIAYFNPDVIEKSELLIILKIKDNDAKYKFNEALELIVSYSLLSESDDKLQVHRMIQKIIRNYQLENNTSEKYYKLVLNYILSDAPINSHHISYVFKFAEKHVTLIVNRIQHYKKSKLLRLLSTHGCIRNLQKIFDFLKKRKVKSHIKNYELLHYAILSGKLHVVKLMYNYDTEINQQYGNDRTTLLHTACIKGCEDIVEFLLQHGADITVKCKTGCTVFHYACRGLHLNIVNRLYNISKIQINEKDVNNLTPLNYVLDTYKGPENINDVLQISRLLIDNGADPNSTDSNTDTLLHLAAINACHDFIKYLLKQSLLNVNMKNRNGYTPLQYALLPHKPEQKTTLKTLVLLIQNGANITTTNNIENGLVHTSAIYGQHQSIKYLKEHHDIPTDTLNIFGKSPLHCALGTSISILETDVMKTIEYLISKNAVVNIIDKNGNGLLHVAAEFGRHQAIHYLLEHHNLDTNTLNIAGRSPLSCALFASKSIPDIDVMKAIETLITRGADVNIIDKNGCGLLHIAAQYSRYQVINYLIEHHNLDTNALNTASQSPLLCALLASKSYPDSDVMKTIEFLTSKGADVNIIDEDENGLLHIAAKFGRYQVTNYLIEHHNLDTNALNTASRSPLLCALLASKSIPDTDVMKTIEFLTSKGADGNIIDKDENGLLHIAAQFGRHQAINYLIEHHNLDTKALNTAGQSPLSCAIFSSEYIPKTDAMKSIDFLISKGADGNIIDENENGLLHVAAESHQHQDIHYLIEHYNLDTNAQNIAGQSPLWSALSVSIFVSETDVMKSIDILISKGADANIIDKDGNCLLHVAAKFGRRQVINYLIEHHNLDTNTLNTTGRSPLWSALTASKFMLETDVMKTVESLISRGADVNVIDKNENGLLHVAAQFSQHQAINYLVENHKLDMNALNTAGRSPLGSALSAGIFISETDVMKSINILISKGADANIIDKDGNGLLHVAAEFGQHQAVHYLIEHHNLDTNTLNTAGRNPLWSALSASKFIPETNVKNTIKTLISRGADVNVKDNNSNGLLHIAAEFGRYQASYYLIKHHNFNTNALNTAGRSSLCYALFANKSIPDTDVIKTIEILISKGADVHVIDKDENGLLHIAAQFGRHQAINYLIEHHNLDTKALNTAGQSPLSCAIISSKYIPGTDVMKSSDFLISKGVDGNIIDKNGNGLLHVAAEFGQHQAISYFMEQNYPYTIALNNASRSLLCSTPSTNKSIPDTDVMKTIKTLIVKGADVNVIDINGSGLLHLAAQFGLHQIINYLIANYDLPVNMLNYWGHSPVRFSLFASKSVPETDILKTIKLLIAKGADVNVASKDENSLLHNAAEYGHHRLIEYLIQHHKLSVKKLNALGQNLLAGALIASKSVPVDDIIKTIEILESNGTDVTVIDNCGNGLLHIAAEYSHHRPIDYLIQHHNLPVNATNALGQNPLCRALYANEDITETDVMKTIQCLTANGADVIAADNDGCGLLHVAAQFGKYQTILYLIQNYNMDIDMKNVFGDTPLHCILNSDKSIPNEIVEKIVKYLLSVGASICIKNNDGKTSSDLASPEIKRVILQSRAVTIKTYFPDSTEPELKRRRVE